MTMATKDTLLTLLGEMGLFELAKNLATIPFQSIYEYSVNDWIEFGAILLQAKAIYNHLHASPQLDYHNVAAVELVGINVWPLLESLPKAEVLGSVLNSPLPFSLYDSSQDVLPGILNDQHSANAVCCSELGHICGGILTMYKQLPSATASEDCWHYVYDNLITAPLKMVSKCRGIEIDTQRNSIDITGTTKRLQRPDYLVIMDNHLLVMKGEHKSALVNIRTSTEELVQKMSSGWSVLTYGSLDYIIGFATAGSQIQFFAITKAHQLVPLSKILDLRIIDQCAQIIKIAVNLVRVFEVFSKYWPPKWANFSVQAYQSVNRSDGVVLEFGDCDLVKKTSGLSLEKLQRLAEIHECLRSIPGDAQSLHMIRVYNLKVYSTTIRAHLGPLGFQIVPKDLGELVEAIHSVLRALSIWHSLGWCHGDIRWSNIVYVPTSVENGFWMLIDFDHSRKPGTTYVNWNFHPATKLGQKLIPLHDLIQVGNLMSERLHAVDKAPELLELMQLLCDVENRAWTYANKKEDLLTKHHRKDVSKLMYGAVALADCDNLNERLQNCESFGVDPGQENPLVCSTETEVDNQTSMSGAKRQFQQSPHLTGVHWRKLTVEKQYEAAESRLKPDAIKEFERLASEMESKVEYVALYKRYFAEIFEYYNRAFSQSLAFKEVFGTAICGNDAARTKQSVNFQRLQRARYGKMLDPTVPVGKRPKPPVIGYGNAGVKHMKKHPPVPVRGFAYKMSQHALVVMIPEYCTTKLHANCHHELHMHDMSVNRCNHTKKLRMPPDRDRVDDRGVVKLRRPVFWCINQKGQQLHDASNCPNREQKLVQSRIGICQNCRVQDEPVFVDRDVNASCGMKQVLVFYADNHKRPNWNQRRVVGHTQTIQGFDASFS
ncbi:hypothetical protein MP228_001523 [Amoeboaphelidium protococcarum]|nr:hypothetical protein MP228_001523 [Amoeboaphelidium protococcarum]